MEPFSKLLTKLHLSLINIGKSFVNFSGMSDVQKFIWLFSNENAHVIRELSVFVYDCYMQRFEMLRK